MQVEAIIVNGKKYVPSEGKDCNECAFGAMECTYDYVAVCDLFHCRCFKEAEPDLNTKPQLEQMPVQVPRGICTGKG